LLNTTPTHPPSDFLLIKKKGRCWTTLLGKGSPKTPEFCFTKKNPCRKLSPKTDKNFNVSFSSVLFKTMFMGVYTAFIAKVFVSERMRSTS
jgi:hypothetical protein